MKMKKLLSVFIMLIMLTAIFAGCQGGEEAAPTSDAPDTAESTAPEDTESPAQETQEPSGDKVKITFSAWDVDTQMPYIRPMIDEFMSQNSDIEVEVVDIPSADYTDKLSIDLNGGAASDVIMVKDADTVFSLNKKGQLADMSNYISDNNIDLSIYNGLAENFAFDGKQVGMPVRTDYYILYYNKDIFDDAGVDYPSNDMTWTEFEELAAQLTSGEGADKKYGAHFHTWQAIVENWAVQDGKHTIMGPDYTFMKPYYEMALRMQDAGTIQDFGTLKTGSIHYSGVFQNGQTAMMPMGSWYISTHIAAIKDGETDISNWGISTIPHPEDIEAGNTVGATTPLAINEASENKDAAWKLVEFFSSYEGGKMLAEFGQFPGCINDELLEIITSVDGMPEGANEALKVKGIVLDRPIVEYVNEVNKMLEEEHELIMIGEVSVDEGLENIATRSAEIQGQ